MMMETKNDLLRLVEIMTQEECAEVSELLKTLAAIPHDEEWTKMFKQARATSQN